MKVGSSFPRIIRFIDWKSCFRAASDFIVGVNVMNILDQYVSEFNLNENITMKMFPGNVIKMATLFFR